MRVSLIDPPALRSLRKQVTGPVLTAGDVGAQDLERHVAAEARIVRAVHLSHPAARNRSAIR